MEQIKRLNAVREKQGDLDPEDEALFRRCDALVKRLKGTARRTRREAEGYDDVNTFGVLAAEGFLPGLRAGGRLGARDRRDPVLAHRRHGVHAAAPAERRAARVRAGQSDLRQRQPVRRPALPSRRRRAARRDAGLRGVDRASGGEGDEPRASPRRTGRRVPCRRSRSATSTSFTSRTSPTRRSCASRWRSRSTGSSGTSTTADGPTRWGEQALHHRRGVRLRLVNVGASSRDRALRPLRLSDLHGLRAERFAALVGPAASSISSSRTWSAAAKPVIPSASTPTSWPTSCRCLLARTRRRPTACWRHCDSQRRACSTCTWTTSRSWSSATWTAMRSTPCSGIHARRVWSARPDLRALRGDRRRGARDRRELPVGLRDLLHRLPADVPQRVLPQVPGPEGGSERLDGLGAQSGSDPRDPGRSSRRRSPERDTHPVNEAERRLRHLLLAAGFEEGIRGKQIRLDRAIGTTTPDVIYRAPHHDEDEGVCIYLDGLSGHLHGNPATAEQDQRIRSWLRNNGYEVIEIAVSDLTDEGAMTRHFRKLAGYLNAGDLREALKTDTSWFRRGKEAGAERGRFVLRIVRPRPEERYVNCVPLVPLKAAAGDFSEPKTLRDEPWDDGWRSTQADDCGQGMFVAQVVGKSMEPQIPDGAYCLFCRPVDGTRQRSDSCRSST